MSNITVSKKAKIHVKWKVNPYDYSKDKEKEIIARMSEKYSLPKNQIKVIPDFIMIGSDGSEMTLAKDIIDNIQDPSFQLKLFQEYLTVNNILDYDFDLIKSIDAEINAKMEYKLIDKNRQYTIKWVKWSNFLSYGSSNVFDFQSLKGIVLLNGNNQSGKSTLGIDLIHFLLFGKTDKAAQLEKIFNKHLPEATDVTVEGCINIEGEDYVIKRTLKRPALNKRSSRSKTVQKVEYYHIMGDSMESLEDYDIENQQEENSIKTNKVIKDAIGSENDFDMMICATSSNLDDLIEKKETERGRLLSKWIGLIPLEEKDALAREHFNSIVNPSLISKHYSIDVLQEEIKTAQAAIGQAKDKLDVIAEKEKNGNKLIKEDEETIKTLASAKENINQDILKVDITTLKASIESITKEGKTYNLTIGEIDKKLQEIGDVQYVSNDFDELIDEDKALNAKLATLRADYTFNGKTIESLKKSEYCPTCGRKYDNVDNSAKIAELEAKQAACTKEGQEVGNKIAEVTKKINDLKALRALFDEKNKLQTKKSLIEVKIERLRNEYKDKMDILNEYNKNHEAIDKNNKIDIQLRNTEANLEAKKKAMNELVIHTERLNNDIANCNETIKNNTKLIKDINEEMILVRHWRIYLDMVGKNGISKMVLRKSLPIINAQMNQLLSDICDFTVEIVITDKNDVMFFIVKDGVYSDLSSGSGYEKTAAALALRVVLGQISILPKLNSLILDEVTGRVAQENLENIRLLLEKIADKYQYIMLITHNDSVKSWASEVINVVKEGNISRITMQQNNVLVNSIV